MWKREERHTHNEHWTVMPIKCIQCKRRCRAAKRVTAKEGRKNIFEMNKMWTNDKREQMRNNNGLCLVLDAKCTNVHCSLSRIKITLSLILRVCYRNANRRIILTIISATNSKLLLATKIPTVLSLSLSLEEKKKS